MRKIKKLLIANRGEIAVRIIKSCREMGIATVAVYSEIDRSSLHAKLADEAFEVGPAPASQSYLVKDKIIEVAQRSGSDAIHPGYGFLSENAVFAENVNAAHLIFIGPSAESIRQLGDKTSARQLARRVGVPIVPGSISPLKNLEDAKLVSQGLGYPIMLKASGGGGGKGMRIARKGDDLSSLLEASQAEARSSFGDDRVYIEKYIERPRHIEIQILADSFGNVVHLGERECSIQRRHQKIIEESPSTAIDSKTRAMMADAAVELVKAARYHNAGTIEFILDQDGSFYFLEMNTRLQVEHPVTEMRTGIDLVREQIRIAQNEPLSIRQDESNFRGHSIECRIYAEDPSNNFYPSTGKVVYLRRPSGGGIRDDNGMEEGDSVSPYYDPLISKLITWGNDRTEAIERMRYALQQYKIFGVRNNISLCLWILSHELFTSGEIDTNFLEENFTSESLACNQKEILYLAAMAATRYDDLDGARIPPVVNGDRRLSRWTMKRVDHLR